MRWALRLAHEPDSPARGEPVGVFVHFALCILHFALGATLEAGASCHHLENNKAVICSAGPDGEFDTDDDISNNSKSVDGGGGVFGQLSEALGKMNEPADDGEIGGLLQQALGGNSGSGEPEYGLPDGMEDLLSPESGASGGRGTEPSFELPEGF